MRFPVGSQCCVEALVPDPDAAIEFYAALLGWDKDEAGFGHGTEGWITRMRVASTEETTTRACALDGSVVDHDRGLLADPAGAVFGLQQHEPDQRVNEPGCWDLSTLRTADPERAIAFYGTLLGWRAEPFGALTLWRLPGYVGGLESQPVPRDVVGAMAAGDEARWEVDFRVAAADETAGRAVGLGGTVLVAPHDTPGFRSAELADPQGTRFTVTQFT